MVPGYVEIGGGAALGEGLACRLTVKSVVSVVCERRMM